MADDLNELKVYQRHCKTEIPRCQKLILYSMLPNAYTKRMESPIASQEEHFIFPKQAEKAMSFLEVELREGKSLVINHVQFIWGVADNMKKGSSLRHQTEHSLAFFATRKENS